MYDGRFFKEVSNAFSEVGYEIHYKLINSADYGVPQKRERVFIIGFKNQNINYKFPKNIKLKINLNNLINKKPKKIRRISKLSKGYIYKHLKKHQNYKKIKDLNYLVANEVRRSRCNFRFDNISPCLTTKMGTGGNNVPVIVELERKLTVRECLRLMGFPDEYKIRESNYQSYKQIGNSVVVPIVASIASKVIKKII